MDVWLQIKGPLDKSLKVSGKICHEGVYKPLFGAMMLEDCPGLSDMTGRAKTVQNL
ncbi:MAG: photosynthetic reaction center cytochrome c subunit family protein [Thiotrichales bacterium]